LIYSYLIITSLIWLFFYSEINNGIQVSDENGNVVGESSIAGNVIVKGFCGGQTLLRNF